MYVVWTEQEEMPADAGQSLVGAGAFLFKTKGETR
jgi:hypothetical protein